MNVPEAPVASDPRVVEQFREWALRHPTQFVFTGTLRQSLRSPIEPLFREWITPEKIERNVDQFIERASRRILGRRAVRSGRSLTFVGAIEGRGKHSAHGGKRYHVHLGIGNVPDGVASDHVVAVLRDRWERTRWGLPQCHAEAVWTTDPAAWTAYTMKEFRPDETERFLTNFCHDR